MSEFLERVRSTRASGSPLSPMAPDESFAYVTSRALTFWPNTNANGAFFLEQGFKQTKGLKDVIGTDSGFTFGLANLDHSVGAGKPNQVVGTIRKEALIEGVGVDIMAQIDKRACEAYEINASDFSDGEFSNVSIEIWCDRDRSTFVALTNPGSRNLEDQTCFTAEEAASQGIRRTRWSEDDPYLYQGKYVVVEGCSPIRCRGVAFVPNPADKTANVFEVAASLEAASKDAPYGDVNYGDPGFRGKKRYPLDTPEHVRAAASYFGQQANRDKYTPEQQKHIQNKIDAAKKKFGIGDEENSGFSTADMPSVLPGYDDVDSVDINAATSDDLPDEAFADQHFDPDEVADKRDYPLYASDAHFVAGKPHKGLMKAAMLAHAAGKIHNPSLALKRLQVAHSQLHGAKSMDEKEQLATELAATKTKLAEVQASAEGKDATITEKDTEIAALQAQLKAAQDENASLKAEKEEKAAEEKASARLAKLVEVEGFAVKDEEKAALIETLKGEDELAFENRLLKAKVASLELAAKSGKKTVENASTEEEDASVHAAALGGLDIFPDGGIVDSKVNDILAII